MATLASFNGANSEYPLAGLTINAAGDLFGTTYAGGAGKGLVYEIAKTGARYASAPTTLINFGPDGAGPQTAPIFDAARNLVGTTPAGGAYGNGAVFEIAKAGASYAHTATILTNFKEADGWPSNPLVADAAGDLFGATYGGGMYGNGSVFEIAKTAMGYASASTLLMSFDSPFENQKGGVILDAVGGLFGAAGSGRSDDDGYIFELAKTKTG